MGALSTTGRLDALELGAAGELAAERETKFNVDFDFATILSSSCRILFDIASGQLAELKRVKLPFVSMSASWVFGVNIFDLDLWVQVDSVK